MFTSAAIAWSQSVVQAAYRLHTQVHCDWSAEMKLRAGIASCQVGCSRGTCYIHKDTQSYCISLSALAIAVPNTNPKSAPNPITPNLMLSSALTIAAIRCS